MLIVLFFCHEVNIRTSLISYLNSWEFKFSGLPGKHPVEAASSKRQRRVLCTMNPRIKFLISIKFKFQIQFVTFRRSHLWTPIDPAPLLLSGKPCFTSYPMISEKDRDTILVFLEISLRADRVHGSQKTSQTCSDRRGSPILCLLATVLRGAVRNPAENKKTTKHRHALA